MKKMRERIIALFLVVLMICSVLVVGPMQAKAATTYTVRTEAELRTALENAIDGDVINIVKPDENTYNFYFAEPLVITKDLTINTFCYVEYMNNVMGAELPEALVIIDGCDVTIAGENQFMTSYNGVYAYKLMDENGDTSLTIDSSDMLDEGILIVDDDSNSYASKLTINKGSYSIPTERTTAIAFSNGTENVAVPKANLLINGGEFQENIEAYIGENTIMYDNGEDAWCRYEVRSTIMSEEFESMLTDGKIIVPSAEPEDEMAEYAFLMGYLCMFETEDVCYYPERISDGVFDIAGWMQKEPYDMTEEHRVEVVFEADLDAKELAVAEDVIENIPYKSQPWEDGMGEDR